MDRPNIWAVVVGLILIGIGVLSVISALGIRGQEETRAFGMLMVSLGMLIIAVAHYIAGRRLLSVAEQRAKESAKIFRLFPCAICGGNAANFWCTTHSIKLCADCIPKHHDTDRCLYKPFLIRKARWTPGG